MSNPKFSREKNKKYYFFGFLFILLFSFTVAGKASALEKPLNIGINATAPNDTAKIIMGIIGSRVGIGTNDPAAYTLNVNGNTNITGNLTVSGTVGSTLGVNATNVSAGTFGTITGGGNYTFPANVTATQFFGGGAGLTGVNADTTDNQHLGTTNSPTFNYVYGSGSIRLGDMWGGAGLYQPSGNMVFGTEAGQWIFSSGAVTKAAIDASGSFSGNYVSGSYFNASSGNSENPTIGQIWTQNTTAGDNYLRKSTPAHFISQLGLITTSNIGNYSSANDPSKVAKAGDTMSGNLSMAGNNISLGDGKLYLRGIGDTNHYLWNNASDWEELIAYSGTGFKVTSSGGLNMMTINGTTGATSFNSSTGIVTAPSFVGSLNAGYVSSGSFGSNTGGGSYSFPGTITAPVFNANGGSQFMAGSPAQNMKLKGGSGTDVGLTAYNSSDTWVWQLYGSGSTYGFLNNNWAGWDMMKNIGGSLVLNGSQTVITSASIGSQTVSNSDMVDGQHFAWSNASNAPSYVWGADSNGSSYLAARGSMSVNYANSAGSANAISSTSYGSNNLTYLQTPSDFASSTGWSHYIVANHGDGASYYNYILKLPFWGSPQYRRQTGTVSNATPWYDFLTSENIGVQSINASYVSSGAFGSNTSGGDYSFPSNLSLGGNLAIGNGKHIMTGISGSTVYFDVGNLYVRNGNTGGGGKIGIAGSMGIGNSYWSSAVPSDGLAVEGNVGIGTTGPIRKLDVNGALTAQSVEVWGGSYANYTGGAKIGYLRNEAIGGGGLNFFYTANNTAEINATYTSGMVMLNSGNVGIGTTNPLSTLSVGGSGVANYGIYGSGVNGIYATTGSGGTAVYATGGSAGNGGYDFYAANTGGRSYFAGNVGIGTGAPGYKLDVLGGDIRIASQGNGLRLIDETTATNWQLHSHGDRLRTYNGSAELTYLTTSDTITATYATYINNDSYNMKLHWAGQGGQPTWLWGSNDGVDSYVYNPANFSVNYAGNAGTLDNIDSPAFWQDGQNRTIGTLNFTGVGGNSGQAAPSSDYRIYQAPGPWTSPYPDLNIAYHTGISIGALSGYGGTRFFNNSDMVTKIFSVGEGDNNVRVVNDLLVSGNVGIGTTAPGAKLEVVGGDIKLSGNVYNADFFVSGGPSDTFNASPWYGIGMSNLTLPGAGSTAVQVAGYYGINFATGMSNNMVINGAGNVGIGTTTPSSKLEVNGSVTAASYIYSSDRNLKKNIATIQNPLEKILQLRGVTFNWKKDNSPSVGLIAQEVEKVFPELVSNNGGTIGVQYGNLVAPLIEAVKEQQAEIKTLQNRVLLLEKRSAK